MEFYNLAKTQYYGQRVLQGQEEPQLRESLTRHHRLLFGADSNWGEEIRSDAGGKFDLWKQLLDGYRDARIAWIKERLQPIAALVNAHQTQLVNYVGQFLQGDKVQAIARGVYEGIISGQHMFLYGTAGVGKTTLVELMCRRMALPWLRIDGQTDMADIHMMGGFLPVMGALRWTPSALTMAGNVILLVDELPRIPASVSNVLLQPMAERSMAFSDLADGGMREVDLSPGFTVIGTGNPFHYGGMAQKNEAVFDRFGMGFDMPHPEHAARMKMLQNREIYPPVPPANPPGPPQPFGIPGLVLEQNPVTLLDLHFAVRCVAMSTVDPNPNDRERNRNRLIRISEMVSPLEYRKRVGWAHGDANNPALIERGPMPVPGRNDGPKVLARFIEKFDKLLESVVQEGSNPRGEEMMDHVARVSALANGRVVVDKADVQIAAHRCLRFRLKPYPGQEEKVAELIRIAGAFWTKDSSVYAPTDHTVSDPTWKALGLDKSHSDKTAFRVIFG